MMDPPQSPSASLSGMIRVLVEGEPALRNEVDVTGDHSRLLQTMGKVETHHRLIYSRAAFKAIGDAGHSTACGLEASPDAESSEALRDRLSGEPFSSAWLVRRLAVVVDVGGMGRGGCLAPANCRSCRRVQQNTCDVIFRIAPFLWSLPFFE